MQSDEHRFRDGEQQIRKNRKKCSCSAGLTVHVRPECGQNWCSRWAGIRSMGNNPEENVIGRCQIRPRRAQPLRACFVRNSTLAVQVPAWWTAEHLDDVGLLRAGVCQTVSLIE